MNSKNLLLVTRYSLLNKKGFTLVELLFAITIGLLLLSAIYVAVQSGQRSSVAIEAKTAAQQDVRAALDLMAMEIGMASYWRRTGINPWTSANKGIIEATSNVMRIQMDINDNGNVPDNNEDIRYEYVIADQRITRQSSPGPAQPFLGDDPASGRPRVVRVINNNVGIPVFRYFDGRGNETASIPDIRRVDITLAVEADAIDPNTGQRRRMIYSTSVIPRNHAIQ
jgi:type IV pilus assembly protein PilW